DDQGGGAAQLHRHPFQRRRALLGQKPAHGGRAGEAQLADQGRGGQRPADGRRVAGDDAQRALGEARLIGQFGQGDGGEGGLAGRLDHGGAARSKGRPQLAGQHGGG